MSVVLLGLACLAAGTGLGWVVRGPMGATARMGSTPATMTRLAGYRFVRPLMECDLSNDQEALGLDKLQSALVDTIRRRQTLGQVQHVSVYLRDLESSAHLGINAGEAFSPASLFKVPVLLAALRAAERDPTILDRQIPFTVAPEEVISQNIRPQRELVTGESYTLWAYLEQMIIESDNRATKAVSSYISPADYLRTFQDVGLPAPDVGGLDTLVTVEQYASFFRVLYNSSYLGPEMSERALGLLSRIRFATGLVGGVPGHIIVAHKFGERRYQTVDGIVGNQLHDCGVIYLPGRPYLLCLMTRGEDMGTLAATIRELSGQAYQHIEGSLSRHGVEVVSSSP